MSSMGSSDWDWALHLTLPVWGRVMKECPWICQLYSRVFSMTLFVVLTPQNRVLEKLIVIWFVKFPAFYGTQRFITVFTRAHYTSLRPCVKFCNTVFYGVELLAHGPTPKLEDHPLSAVHNCLFNIFTATFHICRSSPPSTTEGHCHAIDL